MIFIPIFMTNPIPKCSISELFTNISPKIAQLYPAMIDPYTSTKQRSSSHPTHRPSCVAGRVETGSEGRSKVPRSANFKRIRPVPQIADVSGFNRDFS